MQPNVPGKKETKLNQHSIDLIAGYTFISLFSFLILRKISYSIGAEKPWKEAELLHCIFLPNKPKVTCFRCRAPIDGYNNKNLYTVFFAYLLQRFIHSTPSMTSPLYDDGFRKIEGAARVKPTETTNPFSICVQL